MADRNTKIRKGQLGDASVEPIDLEATGGAETGQVPSLGSDGKFLWVDPIPTADQVPTDETGVSVQDALNTLETERVLGDGSVNPTNLLYNGNFELWSAGASSAPDGWTFIPGVGTIAREATIIKLGTYSAKVYQDGIQSIDFSLTKGITYWRGKTVTFGCWVLATSTNARIGIISDQSANYTNHTGDGEWHFLTVTHIIHNSAGFVKVVCYTNGEPITVYFDGAICVEGVSIFAFSDVPLNQSTPNEIASLIAKTTPVDADITLIEDSASTPVNQKKKLSWTNIKATLKTYFDTLYLGIFEIDVNGDLMPTTDIQGDNNFDVDGNNDIQPKV